MQISINPPPSNNRCQCCGKHCSEVKPFGKAGDPLVGDFEGVLLLKNFRSMAVPNQWFIDATKFFKENNYDEEKFILQYGVKDLEGYYFIDQLINTVEASWECRDCFILSDEEYHKQRIMYWRINDT